MMGETEIALLRDDFLCWYLVWHQIRLEMEPSEDIKVTEDRKTVVLYLGCLIGRSKRVDGFEMYYFHVIGIKDICEMEMVDNFNALFMAFRLW